MAKSRIDGWKAIAAYFGRDRTTVMRWARERELPIRRVPGGGSSSVYAMSDDLDRWLASHGGTDEAVPENAPVFSSPTDVPVTPRRPDRRPMIGLGVATILVVAIVAAVSPNRSASTANSAPPTASLPADKEVAAMYLQARDDWAQRSSAGLKRAVAGFGQVVSQDPKFAPAYVGLAESYLLVREFDGMSDPVAYPRAKAAAQAAQAIEPNLPDAQRVLGFIHYWWERDPVRAGMAFRRARDLAPNNAQTHHWYGNVLADNGNADAALRELNAARLLTPGSPAIQADLGWALWAGGDEAAAEKTLVSLRDSRPDYIGARTYLSRLYLFRGDHASYLKEEIVRATLRAEPQAQARIKAQKAAFDQSGEQGLLREMMTQARADEKEPNADHQWVAVVATLAGDHTATLEALRAAKAANEKWLVAGYTRRIRSRWSHDSAIRGLLESLQAPPMETATSAPI